MRRAFTVSLAVGLNLLVFLFWLAFFSPRPPLMTDAAVLAGDGSKPDYCTLVPLDGTAKQADEIACHPLFRGTYCCLRFFL